MILLGIASITLDVERSRSRVWCSLGPGYGSACLEDGGINRCLLSGFIDGGPGSSRRGRTQCIPVVSHGLKHLVRRVQGRNSATALFWELISQHSLTVSQSSIQSPTSAWRSGN